MIEYFLPLELKEGASFGCPVCGSYLAGINKPEICEHVLFIHDRNSNDFTYCNEQANQIVQEEIKSQNNSGDSLLESLIGSLKATTTIFFEVTVSDPDKDQSEQVLTIGIDLSM
jgi:hypothetical protein